MRYVICAVVLVLANGVAFGQCANGQCKIQLKTTNQKSISAWQMQVPQTAPKAVPMPIPVPMVMPGPATVTKTTVTTTKSTTTKSSFSGVVVDVQRVGFLERIKNRMIARSER